MLKPKEMEIVNRALDCYAHAVNEDFDQLRFLETLVNELAEFEDSLEYIELEVK